ncbi:MAG: DNA pilot protein [Microvirus sp.]|nr:MAG: DNA pilot protein [Microvirus sp.]
MGLLDGLTNGLTGGIISAIGQQNANTAMSNAADKQMAFQESQSSTAYQRATQDMQKAGINPMLAYMQGGASSSPGAMSSSGNVGGAFTEGAQAQSSSALNQNLKDKAAADTQTSQATALKVGEETKGVTIDNALKPAYAAAATKNAASSALQAQKAGVNSIYNTGKQALSDMGSKLDKIYGTDSSAKSANGSDGQKPIMGEY